MSSNTTFGFPVPRKLALSSCWVLFSAVGVGVFSAVGVAGVFSHECRSRRRAARVVQGHAPREDFEM